MKASDRPNGEGLEREVARIYRLLGAETHQRLLIDHYEIDVHATLRSGPFRLSFVVECKEYGAGQAVSDTDMEKFVVKLVAARQRGLADKGVFVTTSSFSKNARATATRHGIQCLLLRDLHNQLVDFHPYLTRLIQDFDSSNLGRWYVDQTVSEFEDYDALSPTARAGVLHSPAIKYLDHRFKGPEEERLALLGNFGTGKTSLCLAYRAHLARSALTDSAARIPLLIDLRDFRAGLDIQQVIVNTLQRLPGIEASLPVCLELQRLGRFFFLLDGLDEMASRIDRAVINESLQEIDRLRTAGNNRYIVTCRTHFFQERILDEFLTDYDVLYLTEWSAPQIKTYFSRRFGDSGASRCERILSDARIADLAKTPLLLDILLETDDLDSEDINVYKLLTKYTDGWIVKQSKRRGTVMTSHQRRRFVLTLASHMYTKNASRLHFSDLYEVAREFCGHRDASRIDHFDADARTCTFITRDSSGNYSFRYQAFSDYFSASAIGDSMEIGDSALLGARELTSEIAELIVGRGITADGSAHLQTWATKYAQEALSSNAVRILSGLGVTLPEEVRKHYKLADQDLAEIRRQDAGQLNDFFMEVVSRYGPELRVFARTLHGNHEIDADDLVNDVFARLWVEVQEQRFKASDVDLISYLLRMVRNETIDRARAARRGRDISIDHLSATEVEQLLAEFHGVDSSGDARLSEIELALSQLSPQQRLVMEKRIEGHMYDQIATAMDLDRHQVEVLLKSARRQLRTRLNIF